METGLQALNKGSEVTFHREGVGTIVDVSLASPKLAPAIIGWAGTNICPSSDHLAPQMILKLDNMKNEIKWNFHRAHWKGFTVDLEDLSAKGASLCIAGCNHIRNRVYCFPNTTASATASGEAQGRSLRIA